MYYVPITEVLPESELRHEIEFQKAKKVKFALVIEGNGYALWRKREPDEHFIETLSDFYEKKNHIAVAAINFIIKRTYN